MLVVSGSAANCPARGDIVFLAATFGLDPSTITRQVRALEDAGLAARTADASDRRASILDLTPEGRDILDRTRTHRRERLSKAMHDWTDEERVEFGRLLAKFNVAVDRFTAEQVRADAEQG